MKPSRTSPRLATLACAAVALLAAQVSRAADFTLAGQASFHNDVVRIDFTVNAATEVKLWTDSWLSAPGTPGTNFDPYLSLFSSSGALVTTNDDAEASFGAGPGNFDSGLVLTGLAGSYHLTLTAAPNSPNGNRLADGFTFDSEAPIAIGQWDQPGYDLNANDQKGTFWRVQLQGVDQAAVVPEPASLALMLAGLLGMGWRVGQSRRR